MVYRRRRRNRKTSQYSTARKAVKNVLSKMAEVKVFATNGHQSISTAGYTAVPLSGLAQGLKQNERIGAEIRLLSLAVRCNFVTGGGTHDPNNTLRMLLLQLHETTNPTTGAIWKPADYFNPLTYPFVGGINSPIDRTVVKRVLMDKMVSLNPQWDGAEIYRYKKGYSRFGKLGTKIQFINQNYPPPPVGGLSALPLKGHFVYVWVSDSTAGSVFHPSIQYSIEAKYTDV